MERIGRRGGRARFLPPHHSGKPGGWLFFEIGYDQGKDLLRLMKDGGFIQVEIRKDLAGLDRVVFGRKTETELESNV